MPSTRLAALALLVSALAVGIAIVGATDAKRPVDPSPRLEVSPRRSGLAGIDERLAALERSVEALTLRPVTTPPESRRPAANDVEPSAELQSRLAEIERSLAELEERRRAPRRRPHGGERDEETRRSIEQWTDLALSRDSTPAEMLVALRSLRGRRRVDGTDARLAVLPEMLQLAQSSDDGGVRADVWRQLHGVEDPLLLMALLDALANDVHAGAREEAAESLSDYMPAPAVESALRLAAEYDEDSDVRRQATETLTGR